MTNRFRIWIATTGLILGAITSGWSAYLAVQTSPATAQDQPPHVVIHR